MRLSPDGLHFLTKEEGVQFAPYLDQAGKTTIGVGHLLTPDELAAGTITIDGTPVPWRPQLTAEQVTALLAQDCAERETALSNLIVCPLGAHQFDALFSLYFNIGDGNFKRSSLLKILNGGDWRALEEAWLMWKWAGGKPMLLGRRQREVVLWNTPDV